MYKLTYQFDTGLCNISQRWHKNGKLHRENFKPAVVLENNLNNKICKQIGVSKDKEEFYFLYGKKYLKNEDDSCLYKSSIDGFPNVIYSNGTKEYEFLHKLHRRDGPAVVYSNGDCEWWFMGFRHRDDGPAVIYGDKQYWFENGEFVKCI